MAAMAVDITVARAALAGAVDTSGDAQVGMRGDTGVDDRDVHVDAGAGTDMRERLLVGIDAPDAGRDALW